MANSDLHKYSVQEALNIQTGGGGADVVLITGGDVTLSTHSYCAITALTECDVDVVSSDTDIWDSATAIIIPKGTTIYGNWTSVLITAGDSAIVYRTYSTD